MNVPGWALIVAAVITSVPATISAVYSIIANRKLRTPNGDEIGVAVEKAHTATLENQALIQQVVDETSGKA